MPMRGGREPWGRWRVMAVYWAAQAVIVFFGWPVLLWDSDILGLWFEPGYVAVMAVVLGFVMVLQAALVAPVEGPRAAASPRPPRLEIVIGGAAVGGMIGYAAWWALLAIDALRPLGLDLGASVFVAVGTAAISGLMASVLIACWAKEGISAKVTAVILGLVSAHLVVALIGSVVSCVQVLRGESAEVSHWLGAVALLLALNWCIGAAAVYSFMSRSPHPHAFDRLISRVLLGTMVEIAAIIPLDVLVRRRSSCYCDEGTLWGLTFCWAAGTIVLGPAMWLIPLGKRRRRWHGGHCEVCGYDMSGCMSSARCPECGTGWRTPAHVRAVITEAIQAEQERAALGGAEGEGAEIGPRGK